MADTYLRDAVDRLLSGLLMLKDSNGKRLINQAQRNLMPLPTMYPFVIAYQGGFNTSFQDEGDSYEVQGYTITLRYILGKVEDGLDGYYQDRLWIDQVRITNWINDHPTLAFTAEQQDDDEDLPELDRVRVQSGTRLGIFRDDPNHIGIEINVSIPFHVERDRLW